MTPYDEFAYPSTPLPQTQLQRLVVRAALLGVKTPDPQRCRVLEVGCSDAGNLAWLAAYSPDSTFLGVDLSRDAVERAQGVVDGLPNIEVRRGDLTTLDAGAFDIVIAHGVYSWLPAPSSLLACIDRHLSADGLAYVSYNVLPGCHLRQMAGDPLRRFTGGDPGRLDEGRALLEWLASIGTPTPHAEMMRKAAELAVAKPDHLLVHDEMAAHNHPVYFEDFVADAAVHNLTYLGEAHLADTEVPEGVEVPDWLPTDEVARQQVLDYARNRAFRQTVLVRPGNAPHSHQVNPAALEGLWACAPAQRTDPTTFTVDNGLTVTTEDSALLADLTLLAERWPQSVPMADLTADREVLLRIHAARGLELTTQPTLAVMPGSTPEVVKHVRRRALVDGYLASTRHLPLTLDDPISRHIVAHCDGRASRDELVDMIRGLPGATARPRRDLDALLTGLGRAGLMVR